MMISGRFANCHPFSNRHKIGKINASHSPSFLSCTNVPIFGQLLPLPPLINSNGVKIWPIRNEEAEISKEKEDGQQGQSQCKMAQWLTDEFSNRRIQCARLGPCCCSNSTPRPNFSSARKLNCVIWQKRSMIIIIHVMNGKGEGVK